MKELKLSERYAKECDEKISRNLEKIFDGDESAQDIAIFCGFEMLRKAIPRMKNRLDRHFTQDPGKAFRTAHDNLNSIAYMVLMLESLVTQVHADQDWERDIGDANEVYGKET